MLLPTKKNENEADSLIYATEKSLKDLGAKVSDAEKQNIETAVAELKKAVESGNTADIKAKTESLKQASYKLAEEAYKQSAQAGSGTADAGTTGNGGNESASSDSGEAKSGFDKGSAEDVDYEVHDDK